MKTKEETDMENKNLFQIWNQLQTALADGHAEPSCQLWLKQVTPRALTENTLLLDAPNKLTRDWIGEHYQDLLETYLTQLCGAPIKLVLEINPGKKKGQDAPVEPDQSKIRKQESAQETSPGQETWQTHLSPKYEFENFVVGSSNNFAHAAAMAVANNPGKAFNPFFLYSDSGLGKTHLMNAIGNRIHKNHPEMKILYTSSENFTNEMIAAIGENKTKLFKDKYRNIDVLLIDDIQFLRGKDSTQEEFFHTFNTLKEADKQIIISSDRPPEELDKLEDRLITRFSQGLSAQIQHPDLETRSAILKNMAAKDQLAFPDNVIQMIASNIKTNIRELEGAYTKVRFHAEISRQPISLELAQEALKDLNMANEAAKLITPEAIQQKVAAKFKIKPEELKAKSRARTVAYPRQIAMYLTRELTELSLPKIGEWYGGRDHTTVLHACDKIASEKKKNPGLEQQLQELINELKK